ncbi:MAG: YbaB/EbfC family nucleoid-associated protein [Clostridiales bacterium]|jgi:DNA-binding YbaB/EbfC family protein|nr:YbaB/EbfC family nucleoid-associated protein [Clostridiales bacterium]
MPKGYAGMPGNLNNLVKQAQKMQRQMADAQEELESREFEASAGGGAVKIVLTGRKEIKSVSISPDAVDPDDVETLEDLIKAAANEAFRQADETISREMAKITGGMNLPGGLF